MQGNIIYSILEGVYDRMCHYRARNVKKSSIHSSSGMRSDFLIKLENKNCGERNTHDGDLALCDFVLEIMNQTPKLHVNQAKNCFSLLDLPGQSKDLPHSL